MIRNHPRILLRADLRPHVGLGHFVRGLRIARALRRRGVEVLMAVDRPPDPELRWSPKFITVLGHDPAGLRFRALARCFNPDVVVWDLSGPPTRDTRLPGRALQVALSSPDDFPGGGDLYIDTALSGISKSRPADLVGPAYAILDSSFRRKPARRFGPPRRVLVALGGKPSRTTLLAVLSSLARSPLAAGSCVRVALGTTPAVSDLPTGCPAGTEWISWRSSLRAEMGKADIAISGGGGSKYELFSQGTPSLLIPANAIERGDCQAAVRMRCALMVRRSKETRALDVAIRRLVEDAGLRRRLSERASSLVDGKGTERVVRAILSLQRGSQ